MPFDATPNSKLANRVRLIEALRRPMPKGFTFCYNIEYQTDDCGAIGCAMGLAKDMGIIDYLDTANMARALGISKDQARRIFYDPTTYGFEYGDLNAWEQVTPTMVADALERV